MTHSTDISGTAVAAVQRKRNVFDVLETLATFEATSSRAPTVLVRVDFNVPMDPRNGHITDDSRMRGALPTLQALLQRQPQPCNLVLVSHLGRPNLVQTGQDENPEVMQQRHELSLAPVATHLATLMKDLASTVTFVDDCLRADVAVADLPATGGAVLLLENLRFYKQEEKNNHSFAAKLASYADAFINDAFGTCHRAHASTAGVPQVMAQTKSPSVVGIGCLVKSELDYLEVPTGSRAANEKVVAIIGGSKVSTKLPVIRGLLRTVDTLILGGGLAYTFVKAMNIKIGTSLVEDSMIDTAKALIKEAKVLGKTLVLPMDAICHTSFPKAPMKLEQTLDFDLNDAAGTGGIEEGYMGLDIGPKSVQLFREHLVGATKVIFNGPMGVFEVAPFDAGTRGLVQALAEVTAAGTITVVGGGDSVAALEQFGMTDVVSYISTGGGATLELLAGDQLPGVTAIPDFEGAPRLLKSVPEPLKEPLHSETSSPTPSLRSIGGIRKRNVFDVLDTLGARQIDGVASNVLVRVDFNVPMQNGVITDDSRIRGALPTIRAILSGSHARCNVILISHMGRPSLVQTGEEHNPEVIQERHDLSLAPVAVHLSNLLNDVSVAFVEDCLKADDDIKKLPATGGGVMLLENLRFYKDEEKNKEAFAEKLASYADAFINDAFGTCHRAHASTAGVPKLVAAHKSPDLVGIGCLVASELKYLDFSSVGDNDKVAAIIGGSKVSTKLPVIKGLLKTVDVLILGGGLAYTFIKAMNIKIGDSLVEEGMIETAKELIKEAKELGTSLVLPIDAICYSSFPRGPVSKHQTIDFDLNDAAGTGGIEVGFMGLDIGPKSVALFKAALQDCTKIVFNGPMGVFEVPPFDEGTRSLVDVLEYLTHHHGVITVVGGGDSVAALEQFQKMDAVSYVSTGGGATLELLAGDLLPGVTAIPDFS